MHDLIVIRHPEHPGRWKFHDDRHAEALGLIGQIGLPLYSRRGFHSDWLPAVIRLATHAGAAVVFPAEGLIPRKV